LTGEHHDAIIIMMRTTLNLPDDVYQAARSYARLSEVPLGEGGVPVPDAGDIRMLGHNFPIRPDCVLAF